MSTQTIPISSQELDSAIEVLASAGQALQLSRLARISYRTLVICADLALASMAAFILLCIAYAFDGGDTWAHLWLYLMIVAVILGVLLVSVLVAIIALALNLPLFRKAFREEARLKKLGLTSLAQFLWKESRQHRRMSRVREALIVVIGLACILFLCLLGRQVAENPKYGEDAEFILMSFMALVLVFIVIILLSARYLRNQRSRMDLTSSADGLRKTLQSLRQRAGDGVVSVPAELLERTAKIESTQIAAQRKDAVLESAAFRDNAYAIAYDGGATEQRATLETADRLELEDLVAQLSTEGVPAEAQPDAAREATVRRTTENNRVEIEYSVDEASRRIRIGAVAPMSGAETSPAGARHA
jgi:hypothetical protein